MNNLNDHCWVFIRVFQGKKMPPLFFPPWFFSFLSHLFYVLHRLFSCHLNPFFRTMGCMRAEGADEEYSPCWTLCDLTLINEGADMGRIWEREGEIRGPEGTRRRRARRWQRECQNDASETMRYTERMKRSSRVTPYHLLQSIRMELYMFLIW